MTGVNKEKVIQEKFKTYTKAIGISKKNLQSKINEENKEKYSRTKYKKKQNINEMNLE